jgi:hypothetical protein
MPGMPRINGKTTKIAYRILGVPANLKSKRTEDQKRVNRRLIFEETVRVR